MKRAARMRLSREQTRSGLQERKAWSGSTSITLILRESYSFGLPLEICISDVQCVFAVNDGESILLDSKIQKTPSRH